MIICYLGGIGSGKTVSVVREIVLRQQIYGSIAFTNFRLKNIEYTRLKVSDIINEEQYKTQAGNKSVKTSVNWEFWDKVRKSNPAFCIYLDEIHNLIHARNSMSRTNKALSKWVSQIRKMLYDKANNHLFIISQTIRKIDVDFREISQVYIQCKKLIKNNEVYILQTFYNSYDAYLVGRHYKKKIFRASPFYGFYDTNEIIKFGDAEVYL